MAASTEPYTAEVMVSGAAHTTAPVVPDHQDRAGNGDVSSVFLMCLSDRVFVYGDGAVNPDPTAEHLAGIAIQARQRTGTPGGASQATPQGCIPPAFSVAPTPGAGTVHADEGDDMTVEAANVRLSVIEQTWQAASAEERLGYLDELAAMAGILGQVTGPQAENAEWLTRRLHRVVRHITHDPGQR